jgi:hypothetical protein
MFQSKDLDEKQVASLRQWAEEGDQLADLQRKLKDEYSLNVTYMDMRFVVLDLGLEIQKEEEPEPEVENEDDEAAMAAMAGGEAPAAEAFGGGGSVSVTVDQIATPGAMVSGRVTFSDGENGRWMIDQMGRPSLDPDTAGYQPTREDLMSFQTELRAALESEPGLGM